MKRLNIINKSSLILGFSLVCLLFITCSDDKLMNGNYTNGKDINLQFEIQTLKSLPPKSITKSGQISAENAINQIQILVFESNKYKYRTQGLNIVNDGSTITTFEARIKTTIAPVIFFVVANADAEIAAQEPLVGEDIEITKTRFARSITQVGISGNLPMWGSYSLPAGISASAENNISGIKMLRSMARIDVVNATTIPFQLATIQAFHVADKMQIIPNNLIGRPSVPSAASYSIATDVIATTSVNTSIAQLYLPEAVSPGVDNILNATCIVIGGYYNGSSTLSYYRLDFNLGLEGHPFGQILRNHRYEFNITRINRDGYPTALEALNNISSGVSANIVLWKDYIRNIVFNSDVYFGVSSNMITLQGKINFKETVLTETDVSSYTIRWANSAGVPQDAASTTSITNEYFKVEKSADGSTIDITTLTLNPIGSGVRNIRYVLVEAQKLQMLLTLLQEPDQFNPGNVTWSVANVDLPGTFAAKIQNTGMFYQWNRRVAWPATGDIAGWNTQEADGNSWEDVTDPCPPGWRVPSSTELLALLKESPGRKWRSIYSGYEISGMWFAPTQAEAESASFSSPGNAIFLPASGGRTADGNLFNQESNGYYWADNLETGGAHAYALNIVDGTSGIWVAGSRTEGYNIRCVRANN